MVPYPPRDNLLTILFNIPNSTFTNAIFFTNNSYKKRTDLVDLAYACGGRKYDIMY